MKRKSVSRGQRLHHGKRDKFWLEHEDEDEWGYDLPNGVEAMLSGMIKPFRSSISLGMENVRLIKRGAR